MKSIPEDSLLRHITVSNQPKNNEELVYECPVTGQRSWVTKDSAYADYGWMYVKAGDRPAIKVSTCSLRQPVLFSEDQRDELADLMALLVVPRLCSVTGREKEELGMEFCRRLQKSTFKVLTDMLNEFMPAK